MKSPVTVSLLLLGAALVFAGKTEPTPSTKPPVVTKFLDLFDRLRTAEEKNKEGEHRKVSFQLTEAEVNEYMRYSLKTTPRPGVESVTVKFFPKDYISTFTLVDFDAVEKWRPGTIPRVLRPFLKGKKSIWIDCRIHADNSQMTFSVEKARYEDMALPAFLVEKMIQIVGARQPEKYDTSKPVPLPFGLRKITTADHVILGNN